MSSGSRSTNVALSDLAVGDIIKAYVIIDTSDIADPAYKTSTKKKIQAGKPIRRMCVVLAVPGEKGPGSADVSYLATFNHSKALPPGLEKVKDAWYPIDPAPKEIHLDPLPPLDTDDSMIESQWVSIRRRQSVTATHVDLFHRENIKMGKESVQRVNDAIDQFQRGTT